MSDDGDRLTGEQRYDAASQDVNVLAVLMVLGSTAFAALNMWIGTLGWIGAALTVSSTLAWAIGLFRRSPAVAAFLRIGYGFSGLAAPIVGVIGLLVALVGYRWGWAVLGGAVVYFFFSVLGLAILERAETQGVIEPFMP